MSDPILQAHGLTRLVGDRTIVKSASFDVSAGEILALVGPSGSGKTSLLRLLNRLDEPASGEVLLKGVDTSTLAPRELRRRIGMVMQRAFLFPGTVADNVRFGPLQHGDDLDEARISELLDQVGLHDFASRSVDNLSGGEAQRVSLARALANDSEVLLADEPTSALDDAAKRQVESVLSRLVKERRLACVLVTHDEAQAARLADRVLRMNAGQIEAAGTVAEVLRAPKTD